MSNSTKASRNEIYMEACKLTKECLGDKSNSVLLSGAIPKDLIIYFHELAFQNLSLDAHELFVKTIDSAMAYTSFNFKDNLSGSSKKHTKAYKKFSALVRSDPHYKKTCKEARKKVSKMSANKVLSAKIKMLESEGLIFSLDIKAIAKRMVDTIAMIYSLAQEEVEVALAMINIKQLYWCNTPIKPINVIVSIMEAEIIPLEQVKVRSAAQWVIFPVGVGSLAKTYVCASFDYEIL